MVQSENLFFFSKELKKPSPLLALPLSGVSENPAFIRGLSSVFYLLPSTTSGGVEFAKLWDKHNILFFSFSFFANPPIWKKKKLGVSVWVFPGGGVSFMRVSRVLKLSFFSCFLGVGWGG